MADTHIKINAVTPRVQYIGDGSTTSFPYAFAIFDDTDMVVYVGDEIIETGYTVTGAGQTEGGNVVFDTAPENGVIITLLRNVPIERVTDFQEGGTFRPKNLNDEFDRQTAFAQQVQEALSRCVKVDPTSETNPEEILPKVERLYESADNIDIVANDKANVDAVAGNATNIGAVAGNESNINTVAGISSDVSTVAGNTTDISNVATNMSDVNDCADNIAAIQVAPAAAESAAASAQQAQQAALSITNGYDLFDRKWSDHLLNDQSWLRADTFSWQDGTVYSDAYQHLVDDVNGSSMTYYAWETSAVVAYDTVFSLSESPSAGENIYVDDNGTMSLIGTITSFDGTNLVVNGTTYTRNSSKDEEVLASQTETVGSYTITYVLAADGHKITTDETTVANIYSESGVAWYYILDTTNQRFKLPRENPAREELVETVPVVGNGTALGLLADTGVGGTLRYLYQDNLPKFGFSQVGSNVPVGTAATSWNTNNSFFNKAVGVTTNENNSGIIAKFSGETTKSVFKGHKYLYFYVGNFTQTSTEQTAGLNSELFNGKVDLNAANLSTAGKSLISGLGMPGNRYIDLTLLASGSTYTAPANGYFSVSKYANGANQFLGMFNATNKIACFWHNSANGNLCEQFIPVKKGDVITINYNLGGNTQRFVFIYAEGEENV